MRVDIVMTESAFADLRADWNALAERAESPSVFLFHDWFAAAWQWRCTDSELRILVAYVRDAAVAILPLVFDAGGRNRRRTWTLLTVPDTQSCDIVTDTTHAAAAAAAFATSLVARRDWDVLRLDFLLRESYVSRLLLPELRRLRVNCTVEECGRNLFIPLDLSWGTYYSTRSRSLKKASNLAVNRLEKAGAVRIERLHSGLGDAATRERLIEDAIEVSKKSWKQSTGNSLDHPGPGKFIRALSNAAHRAGWLSVWIAYLDDRPVAMEYQLVFAGNVHALRSDFDAEQTNASPGSYLFRHLIEALFGQGLARYFMGPGDNAYKTRWSDDGIRLVRAIAYHSTHRGRLSCVFEMQLKPALRRLRDFVRARLHTRGLDAATPADSP